MDKRWDQKIKRRKRKKTEIWIGPKQTSIMEAKPEKRSEKKNTNGENTQLMRSKTNM